MLHFVSSNGRWRCGGKAHTNSTKSLFTAQPSKQHRQQLARSWKQQQHQLRLAARQRARAHCRPAVPKTLDAPTEWFTPEERQLDPTQTTLSSLEDAGKATPTTPSTMATATPTTSVSQSPVTSPTDAHMDTSMLEPMNLKVVSADILIDGMDAILTQRAEASSINPGESEETTPFHGHQPSPISIKNYLKRIHQYLHFSHYGDEAFVLGLVYMQRSTSTWSDLNLHRLLFVAIMIATKMHNDFTFKNSYYARVAGLPVAEVNDLEARLLKMLDWDTFVQPEEFQRYHDLVCRAAGHREPL